MLGKAVGRFFDLYLFRALINMPGCWSRTHGTPSQSNTTARWVLTANLHADAPHHAHVGLSAWHFARIVSSLLRMHTPGRVTSCFFFRIHCL